MQGYIDPGVATLLMQVVFAALATCLFFYRRLWNFLRRMVGKAPDAAPPASQDPPLPHEPMNP